MITRPTVDILSKGMCYNPFVFIPVLHCLCMLKVCVVDIFVYIFGLYHQVK